MNKTPNELIDVATKVTTALESAGFDFWGAGFDLTSDERDLDGVLDGCWVRVIVSNIPPDMVDEGAVEELH